MLPIIDASGIAQASAERLRALAQDIGRISRDTGFFYIVNHGVPQEAIEEVFAMAQSFFALPEAVKARGAICAQSGNRGYVHLRTEALDPANHVDNKEAFNIGLELDPDDPEIAARIPSRALNPWPDLAGFRRVMVEHYNRMLRLGLDLHQAIAVDLGVSADYFEPFFDKSMSTLRLLHYPPAQSNAPGQIGAGAHTDYGSLTILATDDAGGLEVRKRDGQWIAAPPIPGAFICNIGDCLMRWTNDVYVSTPHRVANPVGRDRHSIAFFLDANPDALVEVLESCCDQRRPPRYPPIRASDYLAGRFAETYGFKQADKA
jgi:isopenicillin N synthase-like dioxygenase